ncbi:MAG: hypothetical protein ACFHWX_09080 [Bacteroidota bacterium]
MDTIRIKWILSTILTIFISLSTFTAKGQLFMRPRVNANTTNNQVAVSKVEITDKETIISLWVKPRTNSSVYFSSKTYIVSSTGGKQLFISGVKDMELDKLYTDPNDEAREYTLYFPKIETGTQSINLRAGEEGNYWHFFDIDISTDIGADKSVKSGMKGEEDGCKFIKEPGYTAKTNGFEIRRIDICDDETVLYFEVKLHKGAGIYIPSKSAIRNSKGGEDIFVIEAEGTNMDEMIVSEAKSGEIFRYKLVFPPLDASIKHIDFRELTKGGTWFVYEMDTDVSEVK